jgi:heat shock protein HslJ
MNANRNLVLVVLAAALLVGCSSKSKSPQAKSSGKSAAPAGGDRSGTIATPPVTTATAPSSPLAGKSWTLTMVEGAEVPPPAADRRQPGIVFAANGRVTGHSGVNTFSGNYTVDGQNLKFSGLAMSRMAGPEPAMAVEKKLVDALRATTGWRITGGKLELMAGDRVVARYDPINA